MVGIEIAISAHKHGVMIEQILAVISVPFRLVRIGDDRVLFIGADPSGQLLEVICLDPQESPLVIHAMPLRSKFAKYL